MSIDQMLLLLSEILSVDELQGLYNIITETNDLNDFRQLLEEKLAAIRNRAGEEHVN